MTDQMPAAALSLRIAVKREIARGITFFELRAAAGAELPLFTAGAHVKLRTPNGFVRKYSLCNDPAKRDCYAIAVKWEAGGRGGSIDLIDCTRVGDALVVAPPVNDFALAPRSLDHLFIAGGIGITPIISMVRQLQAEPDKRFRLYYCARTPEVTAFLQDLSVTALKGKVVIHYDNGDPARSLDLWPILEERKNREHLYCCGPRPLMEQVREMTGHWSSTALHFEAFIEPEKTKPTDKPFVLRLARTGLEFDVPVGVSILDAMRTHGCDAPSSCESGTCGTCRTKLLDGEADHRDLVLTEGERRDQIMLCVSRAVSAKLVIDR